MRTTIVGLMLLAAAQLSAATPEQSPRQIIPAVANLVGLDGSVWSSDVVVFNPSDREVSRFAVKFLPRDPDLGFTPGIILDISLGTGQSISLSDLSVDLIPEGEAGALIIEAEDTNGDAVPIVVDSRTWSGDDVYGTYGQGISAVAWSRGGDLDEPERRIVGLESSEAFRSNLGIVNLSSAETIFLVEILDPSGAEAARTYLSVGSYSQKQVNDILGDLGVEGEGHTAVVRRVSWTETGGPPDFVVYGSLVDRRTNDPTYLAELPETTQSGLPKHRVVPAAARTEGNDGSSWRTDLTVHSAADGGVTALIVELVPTGGAGLPAGNPERYVTSIHGGETKTFDDIIGTRFDDHELAALVVQGLVGGGSLPDLRVVSRTWTPTGDGEATMGQGIPGIPRRSVADPVVIPGLEQSEAFRTNIGFVNPSLNIRKTLDVEILDADGVDLGGATVTLEPWSHVQIDSILDQVDAEGSGYTAVVTLTGSENLMLRPSESWEPVFMAYGSRIDRRTNDPSYIEGVRLTPPPAGGQGDWFDFSTDEPWYRCPDEPIAEEATVVRAFDKAYHWFGSENHRRIIGEVDFPAPAEWNQVGLRIDLECPESGLCDHWDRTGSLEMVLNPEDPEEDWEYLEIMRYITPYRVGMCQYVDITPLAGVLTGTRTLVSSIDTWVGPGHSDGEGWRITFDVVFYPGDERAPDEVVNIWGRRTIEVGNLDPGHTVDDQIDPVELSIPADASRVEARMITTGHAYGNTENCAEFCPMRQDLYLDGERRSVLPWRTDCEHNPVNNQQGTWLYDRNGWCPGAVTIGNTIDVTDMVTPGETATLDFDIRMMDGREYENTSTTGSFDPIEYVSLQVYIYRD